MGKTLTRWRARAIELPDYHLLLIRESWGATLAFDIWGCWLGPVPVRVVPAAADADRLQARIAALARVEPQAQRGGRTKPGLPRWILDQRFCGRLFPVSPVGISQPSGS